MDTFKFYVFLLMCITLIFVQTNVDAALGADCSADPTVCDTSNNEICTGTTCACDNGYYESGGSCASMKVYGESCTAGSSNECQTRDGVACISIVNKCLCTYGSHYTGATCTSNNALKPITLQSTPKTYNTITLSWTSPGATDYTNSHVINYSEQGGPVKTLNVNGQDTIALISNLKAGTTYTFTVVRSILREGRIQEVPASDPYMVTTNGVYSDSCTAVGSSTECGAGLVCVSGTENKCLCTSENYFTGSNCISITNLKPPNISIQTTSTTSVTIEWASPAATWYNNSYVIKYKEAGTTFVGTSPVSGDVSTHLVTGLKAGTSYIFFVVRSITREGRTQAVIYSTGIYGKSEKLDYGEPCSSNGTCKDLNLNCYSSICSCNPGYFWKDTSCVINNALKPITLQSTPKTYNTITLSWTSPGATDYTNSHVINYSEQGGPVKTLNVNGQDTIALISNLKAGTTYTFTVVRSILREGWIQEVPASDPYMVTTNGVYSDSCTAVGSSTECGAGLVCVSGTENKCLCTSENYFTGSNCISITNLKPPNISTQTTSTTSVTIEWASPAATWYNNSYVIKYQEAGTTFVGTSPVSGDVSTHLVTGLKAGTSYIFFVVRSITREGRTQAVIYSTGIYGKSEKLDYGEPCSSNGTCKDLNFNCYSSICSCNPGYFWKDTSCLIKPAATVGVARATSLMEPTAQIYFYKAEGRADSYTVTLTGDGYNMVQTASGPEDVLSVSFSGVSAGLYYNLTIITNSHGVPSDPFFKTIRVSAEVSEAVVDLKVFDPTSRAASVSWKRPINTKGALYKYTIEVFNSSACLQRINIQCTECLQAMDVYSSTESSCEREANTTIIESDLNNENFLVRYDLSLLPDTPYTVSVAAYNEDGKGRTDQDAVHTEQEAPGEPTNFRYVSKTSESIELSWTPPEPRPGVTTYIISVYEWDEDSNQYRSFKNVTNKGFYNVSINMTGLSSYRKYSFEMFARTFKGESNTTNVLEVTTAESAPTAVEDLEHRPVEKVYNKYQLSWRCPPQKDGRNGVIRNATVVTSRFLQSAHVNQEKYEFENSDCTWSEPINVTAEFNYTFEVYISNSIKGESTTIQRYMPAGPPSFPASERPVIQVNSGTETDKSVELIICPACLLDNMNGLVVKSGVLVCTEGQCPPRIVDEVKTADFLNTLPNWDSSAGASFSTWFRATEDDWLKEKEASDEIRFVLGEESCGVQDQNRFCNGPLPVDRTYRVWLFACTGVSCAEGNYVKFTLGINNDDSLPGSIIAAIAVVLVVLAAVILVVYIKVIRPRFQRQRSAQYVSDTSRRDDTYAEIGDGIRMSVITDGRIEDDHYSTSSYIHVQHIQSAESVQ